jgi:hypothetical protein
MRGMGFHCKLETPLLILVLLILPAGALWTQEVLDLPALIGSTPEEAIDTLGAPVEVYGLRGEEPRQDDVVFYYANHLYLFWFQSRIWQVRVDNRFAGRAFGLSMGTSRREVLETMGRPILEFPDSLVFHVEDRGYPIRARLYFDEEGLADLYCFRGDL